MVPRAPSGDGAGLGFGRRPAEVSRRDDERQQHHPGEEVREDIVGARDALCAHRHVHVPGLEAGVTLVGLSGCG